MSAAPVYLNGRFLALEEAKISVLDRGFLFADSVYEVIPAYAGRLFRLEHHLERLDNSLRGIRMQPPLDHDQWRDILERLIAAHDHQDLAVYLQVTRGAGSARDHAIPDNLPPTLFAMASPIPPADPARAAAGIAAVTLDDIRWRYCHIKSTALLANVLLKAEAADRQATEAILIRNGVALEGAASNLFLVCEGHICTPPKSQHLLPGITRDLVLELAAEHDLPAGEAEIPLSRLQQADEIWLTSSTRQIMPVVELDGQPVANGRPGPIWERMHGLYEAYKNELRQAR